MKKAQVLGAIMVVSALVTLPVMVNWYNTPVSLAEELQSDMFEYGIEMSVEEIENRLPSGDAYMGTCYTRQEFQEFLSYYAKDYRQAPDVLPAFNNYYQDIGVGSDNLDNLTKWNDVPLRDLQPEDRPDLSFRWYWNNLIEPEVLISDKYEWPLSDMFGKVSCSGAGVMRLVVVDNETGAVFIRRMNAFIGINSLSFCSNGMSQIDTFSEQIWPSGYKPYDYLEIKYDLNGDRVINSADMLIILGSICR
jgi:hypothetical protein